MAVRFACSTKIEQSGSSSQPSGQVLSGSETNEDMYAVNTRLLNSFAHGNNAHVKLLNIDYLIAKK